MNKDRLAPLSGKPGHRRKRLPNRIGITAMLIAAAASHVAAQGNLRVGAARVDITGPADPTSPPRKIRA